MKEILMSNKLPAINNGLEKNSEVKKSEIEEKKLKKACADFESLFIYNLLKTMRKTIPVSNSTMQSYGKDTYYMMFDQKIAEEISNKAGGMGLQSVLFNQLKKQSIKK